MLATNEASLEMNSSLVDWDEIDAVHICQSAVNGSALNFGGVVMASLTFGAEIAGVERHSVFLNNRGVKRALHVVDRLGDEVKSQESVSVQVVQKTCNMLAPYLLLRSITVLTVCVIAVVGQVCVWRRRG